MRKNIYILCLSLTIASSSFAQNGIEKVLQSIETNNPSLQASQQLNKAQKLEARTGIFLPNPTVELNQLWADKSVGGNSYEFAAVQSFDFPTVYSHKNKLARMKSELSDFQYASSRQEILLTAQQVCQEIIYLRQQKQLLDRRSRNAERLSELYQQRLANGDANQLEFNKIQLEKINTNNARRLNAAALKAQLEKLYTLNGGIAIDFTDSIVPVTVSLSGYP